MALRRMLDVEEPHRAEPVTVLLRDEARGLRSRDGNAARVRVEQRLPRHDQRGVHPLVPLGQRVVLTNVQDDPERRACDGQRDRADDPKLLAERRERVHGGGDEGPRYAQVDQDREDRGTTAVRLPCFRVKCDLSADPVVREPRLQTLELPALDGPERTRCARPRVPDLLEGAEEPLERPALDEDGIEADRAPEVDVSRRDVVARPESLGEETVRQPACMQSSATHCREDGDERDEEEHLHPRPRM